MSSVKPWDDFRTVPTFVVYQQIVSPLVPLSNVSWGGLVYRCNRSALCVLFCTRNKSLHPTKWKVHTTTSLIRPSSSCMWSLLHSATIQCQENSRHSQYGIFYEDCQTLLCFIHCVWQCCWKYVTPHFKKSWLLTYSRHRLILHSTGFLYCKQMSCVYEMESISIKLSKSCALTIFSSKSWGGLLIACELQSEMWDQSVSSGLVGHTTKARWLIIEWQHDTSWTWCDEAARRSDSRSCSPWLESTRSSISHYQFWALCVQVSPLNFLYSTCPLTMSWNGPYVYTDILQPSWSNHACYLCFSNGCSHLYFSLFCLSGL